MPPRKKIFTRRKVCRFCADKSLVIDYKDVKNLRNFLTEAIKRARQIALMPYSGQMQP